MKEIVKVILMGLWNLCVFMFMQMVIAGMAIQFLLTGEDGFEEAEIKENISCLHNLILNEGKIFKYSDSLSFMYIYPKYVKILNDKNSIDQDMMKDIETVVGIMREGN